jgi:two-component system, chemotaxis family, protein-glutamate methylesterase/glutaminase
MTVTDIVVVGASAGGVEALRALVGSLPPELPAAVVVVLHIAKHAPSALPAILDRAGPLPAVAAEQGARLANGVIHVAPADRHVLVGDGCLLLSLGPTENGHRPAIDPLFRSAAAGFGARAVGVVLSGTRDDGTAGLAAISERGGVPLVQEPEDALYPGMPTNALQHVPGAARHPADKLGVVIGELLRDGSRPPVSAAAPDTGLLAENRISAMSAAPDATVRLGGAVPSGLTCPSCDGVLFEVPGEPAPRFRCRVGHAWSPDSLSAEQATGAEAALWVALRALEEKAALLGRLADRAEERGQHRSASYHRRRATEAEGHAVRVRALILSDIDGPAHEDG